MAHQRKVQRSTQCRQTQQRQTTLGQLVHHEGERRHIGTATTTATVAIAVAVMARQRCLCHSNHILGGYTGRRKPRVKGSRMAATAAA